LDACLYGVAVKQHRLWQSLESFGVVVVSWLFQAFSYF